MKREVMKEVLGFIERQLKGKATIILAIAALVFFALFVNQCRETGRLKDQAENSANFLDSEISFYKNKLNQEVAQKAALRGDKESLDVLLSKQIDSTQQLAKLVEGFKKVKSAGNIIQRTKIDTLFIPFEKAIDFEFIKPWSSKSEHFNISGVTTNEFTRIDHLDMINTLSFAIGEKSTGFWKTTYQAEAVNSNPYVNTIGLDTYSYSEKKKRFGIGPYIGFDLIALKPSVGLSINFNLIRF